MSVWTEAPEIRCGHCTERFPFAMHWEIEPGHVLECPACGAMLEYTSEEAIRRWSWAVKEPGATPIRGVGEGERR